MDVGTVESYWSAHMDLLPNPPRLDLNDRSWIVHTRTEERPPIRVEQGATIANSMICDGCTISEGARVIQSVLSPGVTVKPGAEIIESIILTDTYIGDNAKIMRAILDKKVNHRRGRPDRGYRCHPARAHPDDRKKQPRPAPNHRRTRSDHRYRRRTFRLSR